MRELRVRVGPIDVAIQVSRRRFGRRTAQLPGGITMYEPPSVEARRHDPQRALDYLRDPGLAGDGHGPNPTAQEYLADAERQHREATDLTSLVATYPWYHTMELPGGVVTPGGHDHRALVDHMGFPADLSGLRALDVATFDGFWAFELERRGAAVTAIDLPSVAHLDWPTGGRDIVVAEDLDLDFGATFEIAREALGSDVERVAMSVYDLEPDRVGTFDFVFMGDLLLHLQRPLDALRAIRSVTRGTFMLADRFDRDVSRRGRSLLRYDGGWHGLQWWAPSLETLVQWVADAGFGDVEVTGHFVVPGWNEDSPGFDRALIRAQA